MLRLLVSTGEVSGDLQGSLLVGALHQEARRRGLELEVVALGGERMERAGAQLLANTSRMGAIGLLEAIPFVLPTLRLQRRLKRWFRGESPDGVVLIDYMGPNVSLGLRLKRRYPQVPITYYIAPQEWAFKFGSEGRTNLIRFTNQILAIFQEEARYYRCRGANVTYVGHPLLDTIGDPPSAEQARLQLDLRADAPVLLLMPASRRQEIRYLLPHMVAAAAELQRRIPGLQVVVPAGLAGFEAHLARQLQAAGVRGRVIAAAEADRLKPGHPGGGQVGHGQSGTGPARGAPGGRLPGEPTHRLGGTPHPAVQCAPHLAGEPGAGGTAGAGAASAGSHRRRDRPPGPAPAGPGRAGPRRHAGRICPAAAAAR
jgi:lipid-A-disaccharide synthase